MDYKEALDWLYGQLPMFSRVGAAAYKPGLERSEALAAHFGHPERRLRCIHVAGTNGKGSVSSLIAATLQAQGYKTALYTSPHLVDFRERMRINGEMIPKEEVVRFVEDWQQGNYQGGKPSFFELTMMMAFRWFAICEVDYAVIEVGMGGRLDSTNIITPLLSVVTNISFDHTQFLGHTLAEIAREKAGIFKPGIPAVVGEADEEMQRVFREHSAAVGTPLREAYREIDARANEALGCSLHGDYQKKNVNTARVALETLRTSGVEVSSESMRCGFSNVEILTGFKGRWTVVRDQPLTICDTGHNIAGLSSNMKQLERLMSRRPGSELRIVIGFVNDKDVDHILDLLPRDADYFVTQAQIPRAMPWEVLLEKMQSASLKCTGYADVSSAYLAADGQSGPMDVIYVGGSTFIVADFLASKMSPSQ